ncbi:MAG: hypothetical protein AAFZ15_32080, partial [Bacteroidota bacterium]
MFEQFLKMLDPLNREKVKKVKFYVLVLYFAEQINPSEFKFLKSAFQIKKENIEQGLKLRPDKKNKIKFLKAELKKARRLIDNEIFRREIKLMTEFTVEQYGAKRESE